jgi:hypothetical protein
MSRFYCCFHHRIPLAMLPVWLLTNFSAAPALAGDEWYQVEVLAFRQAAPDSEQWPRELNLSYPANWQALQTAGELQSLAAQQQAEQLAGNAGAGTTDSPPATSPDASAALAATPDSAGTAPTTIDPATTPYLRLPATDRQLAGIAATLKRRGYDVLFHESWRMPVASAGQTPAILIHGGRAVAEHNELEGSLQLSKTRVLNLHANLWLSSFTNPGDVASGEWPALPPRPDRHRIAINLDTQWDVDTTRASDAWHDLSFIDQEFEQLAEVETYAVNRIVTLREERRLNPGELHYLDNPVMGLVVQLTPYQLPEPVVSPDPALTPTPVAAPATNPPTPVQ